MLWGAHTCQPLQRVDVVDAVEDQLPARRLAAVVLPTQHLVCLAPQAPVFIHLHLLGGLRSQQRSSATRPADRPTQPAPWKRREGEAAAHTHWVEVLVFGQPRLVGDPVHRR